MDVQEEFQGLRSLTHPDFARSDAKGDDGKPLSIVENFENKALMHSNVHYRIAGFWDINWLSQAKKGLEKFLVNGKMNLLIGVPIQNSLKQLIDADKKVKTAGEKLIEHLSSSPELNKWENFKILIWMLQQKKLEVRILIIGHTSTYPRPEHAKIQLYYDQFEQSIGSSGSKNDTNRGNKGGVDFITISKSWSSPEAANQIEAMQKYFDDHWNHTDAVKLEDVHKNPEFKKVLEKLANKESKHWEPYQIWTRRVGQIKEDTRGIVVKMKKSKFKSDFLDGLENVESIDFPDELEMDQIRYVNEFRPEVNILIAAPKNLEDVALEIPSELLAYCHKTDVWNFHSSDGAHICLYDFDFINKIRRFFGFDELKLELEEEEPGEEEEEEELPEEVDDVEVVWNPKYFKKPKFPLRENCQVAGVKHWLENKGCLLEHATGSGKTLTGQMIASHMFDESDVVFITTPFIDIANQWEEDALSNFRLDKVKVFCLHSESKHSINVILAEIASMKDKKLLIITVNPSLISYWEKFQLYDVEESFSIIFDEAHRWTSEKKLTFIEQNLHPYFNSSLSLTARLHSLGDGTEVQKKLLENNKQKHVFSLTDAIKTRPRILSEYEYIIHQIEINPSLELKQAKSVFESLATSHCINTISESKPIQTIVYTKSTSDIDEYDEYGGNASVADAGGARALARRIDENSKYFANPYVGDISKKERRRVKQQYEEKQIQCLVAVKCLDEGVDIPNIKRLFLVHGALSDRRQWIQRRGRALRLNRREDGSIINDVAIIHDYYPIPVENFDSKTTNKATVDWICMHSKKVIEMAFNSKTPSLEYQNYKDSIQLISTDEWGY